MKDGPIFKIYLRSPEGGMVPGGFGYASLEGALKAAEDWRVGERLQDWRIVIRDHTGATVFQKDGEPQP
jgi:hypothetical protein